MGKSLPIFAAMMIIIALIGISIFSRASAEEAKATASRAPWRVETFVESADSPDNVERLADKVARHLNGDSETGVPNAHATKVKLLLSYKVGGSMMATLVYEQDEAEHHYKVHMHKCGTTGEKHRDKLKADLEKLLNTVGVEPHCFVQDSFVDQVIFAVVCEVK
jgi:hypothetical protein